MTSSPDADTVEPAAPVVEHSWHLAGARDGFDRLWTPYRMAYIQGDDKPSDESEQECPFCRAPTLRDEDGLVVARGGLVYVVLNLYPYNTGHIMVVPYRHVSLYTELTPEETAEFSARTQTAMRVLEEVSGNQGFNIGMNQGVAERLRREGIRVEVDTSDDRMQKKIRNASKAKVPYVLIAGEEDAGNGAVSFRFRDGSQDNGVPVEDAVARIAEAVRSRAQA